jgi:chitinase
MLSLRNLLLAGLTFLLLPEAMKAEDRVVAYVPTWVDLEKFAETIDYPKVTHLNLAFANPTNADGDLSFPRGAAALITKAHQLKVAVFISLAGGGASEDQATRQRYEALTSEAQLAGFVTKLTDYVVTHDFDGLDVDLEGEAIGPNYGSLIAALAPALHAKGKQLTAALSRYSGARVLDSAIGQFDFVNIMAYDATGPWNPNKPGQHSSLEYAKNGVAYWLDRGLPKTKVVLGLPFYGYGFGPDFREGGYSYRQIVERFPKAEDTDQTGETIFYNGQNTIKAKTAWAKEQGLGGVMIWSLDGDTQDARSLLTAIDEVRREK